MIVQVKDGIYLLGVGDTINECRNDAISTLISCKIKPNKMNKLLEYFGVCNLNESVMYEAENKTRNKVAIYRCEGKVYIYAGRYGRCGMRLMYDNYTDAPYMRYGGYVKEETKTKFIRRL